jgi:hypothetical protein
MKQMRILGLLAGFLIWFSTSLQAQTAPSTYSGYTGTDTKTIPPAPPLGPANSAILDPTFGSRILRVTDANTRGGESFVSTDSGFHRAWNADSTAIKLTGPHGDSYWMEFSGSMFKVGNVPHSVPFAASWEWSTVDPNTIYFLNGNQIWKYNNSTGAITNLGGPPNGDPVTYMAVVIGQDNWVCAAAGSGITDTYTEIFCVNPNPPPNTPPITKFVNVLNRTVNGSVSTDPNWPTSAAGQTLGIHDVSGGTGAWWLEVTFHGASWGANGGAVFDLQTNTWSEITNSDPYWSGHVSMGNGKYANSAGSVDGRDSRGIVLRNPDNAMNSSQYLFVAQPPTQPPNTNNNWCDSDHTSWLNSMTNPDAPILVSRYMSNAPNCAFAWTGEIYAAAVDGSNTVWRFAHNHDGGCYYGEGFAQISNDGKWALFSSYWDGMLDSDTSFGCQTRIDTFIVQLSNGGTSTSTLNVALAANGGVATASSTVSSAYPASAAIDGDRKGLNWGAGGGWNDATRDTWPDWLEVDFNGEKIINEVDVFTLQDNLNFPSDPTPSMTFSLYGVTDFQVQYWNGSVWTTVPGGSVSGNNLVWRQLTFSPLATSAIRVWVTGAMASFSRITEVEAYTGTNVALAANGGVATASSSYSSAFPPSATIDGDRKGLNWGAGGGWNDATRDTWPDWLEVDFNGAKIINEVDVFTLQDNLNFPSDPTPSMTFTLYGVTAFQVQYWTGSAWVAVPGGTVSGNNLVWRQLTFSPLTTTAIRVWVTGAMASFSRITEVEAYGTAASSVTNVARATNGGVATASSTYSSAFPPSATIDGDRKGLNWGASGGWNDATRDTWPDWLEVDFNGSKTINEVDVFTLQDNLNFPSDPTPSMIFTLYGVTAFQVQYWTGSAWVTVPGGTVSGNNLVWRQLTFSPVTTSAIRVLVTAALASFSRITEVEAYTQ